MLTDAACRQAVCPEGKPRIRLPDAGGLYLEVTPSGSKRWFAKYRFGGKERRLAIGAYPAVGLKDARAARDAARQVRGTGTDPVQARRTKRLAAAVTAATTFEAVAREFLQVKAEAWSEGYSEKVTGLMERGLFPWVGSLPIVDVTAPVLLDTIRRTERRGNIDAAHTLRQLAGQVFKFGVATGRCERNPAADLAGALKPLQVRHMAAVLEPVAFGKLLRDIDAYTGQPVTRAALELSALLFQRPGNIRAMEWAEIDLDVGMWTIPAAKMKRRKHDKVNGRPHLVPLAPQAAAIMRELVPLTGHGRYVFPSLLTGERCMSENTLRGALRRLGYANEDATAHGFRASARTLIAERLPGIHHDVIEAQLGHGKSGPLDAAYDRAEYMLQRTRMMGAWADYLDELRTGAKVLPFKAA